MGAATRFDRNVVWPQSVMIPTPPKRPVACVDNWPPVGVRGGARKLTFDPMALPAKVGLRRPPEKPGPSHQRTVVTGSFSAIPTWSQSD